MWIGVKSEEGGAAAAPAQFLFLLAHTRTPLAHTQALATTAGWAVLVPVRPSTACAPPAHPPARPARNDTCPRADVFGCEGAPLLSSPPPPLRGRRCWPAGQPRQGSSRGGSSRGGGVRGQPGLIPSLPFAAVPQCKTALLPFATTASNRQRAAKTADKTAGKRLASSLGRALTERFAIASAGGRRGPAEEASDEEKLRMLGP